MYIANQTITTCLTQTKAENNKMCLNRGCRFLVQAVLPEGFPFHQFIIDAVRILDLCVLL